MTTEQAIKNVIAMQKATGISDLSPDKFFHYVYVELQNSLLDDIAVSLGDIARSLPNTEVPMYEEGEG